MALSATYPSGLVLVTVLPLVSHRKTVSLFQFSVYWQFFFLSDSVFRSLARLHGLWLCPVFMWVVTLSCQVSFANRDAEGSEAVFGMYLNGSKPAYIRLGSFMPVEKR